jgi:uncharacterized protein (TIGR03083 family)
VTGEVSWPRLARVVEDEGRALLESVRDVDPARRVPGCPGWTVADLLAHLASVYRWVTTIVGERRSKPPSPQERAVLDGGPRDGQELLDALEVAHGRVLATLCEAPEDLDCWTLWPASQGRYYWLRRQAHETLVHRVDAQNAVAGARAGSAGVDPEIAADGVDEMVTGFAAYRYRRRLRMPSPATLSLHATDVDRRWWVRLGPEDSQFGRGAVDDPGQTEVRANSDELLLLLWNRRDWAGLTVTGDDEPLRVWQRDACL